MIAQNVFRLSAALVSLGLIIYIVKNTAESEPSGLLDAKDDANDAKQGSSIDSDIMALAWHPVNKKALKHKEKASIPGLAPWAKALLDTAAKEQIQEVNRHAKSVQEQEKIVAAQRREAALKKQRQAALKKARMEKEIKMLQSKAKLAHKAKSADASKAKAKAHLKAKKAAQAKLPTKLQRINHKPESQFAAYSEVKTFFHDEESQLESKKEAAIKRVKEEAHIGMAKIKKDEKSDLKKVWRAYLPPLFDPPLFPRAGSGQRDSAPCHGQGHAAIRSPVTARFRVTSTVGQPYWLGPGRRRPSHSLSRSHRTRQLTRLVVPRQYLPEHAPCPALTSAPPSFPVLPTPTRVAKLKSRQLPRRRRPPRAICSLADRCVVAPTKSPPPSRRRRPDRERGAGPPHQPVQVSPPARPVSQRASCVAIGKKEGILVEIGGLGRGGGVHKMYAPACGLGGCCAPAYAAPGAASTA